MRVASGSLDISSVDTAVLQAAISQTLEIGAQTREARRFLYSARVLKRLRTALRTSNLDLVAKVLAETSAADVVDEAAPELRQTRDEVDNHTVITELSSALELGQARCVLGTQNGLCVM
jgi:hypothetical protein